MPLLLLFAPAAPQDLTYGDFLAFFATTRRLLPERPYRHFVMEFSELFDLQVRQLGAQGSHGSVHGHCVTPHLVTASYWWCSVRAVRPAGAAGGVDLLTSRCVKSYTVASLRVGSTAYAGPCSFCIKGAGQRPPLCCSVLRSAAPPACLPARPPACFPPRAVLQSGVTAQALDHRFAALRCCYLHGPLPLHGPVTVTVTVTATTARA